MGWESLKEDSALTFNTYSARYAVSVCAVLIGFLWWIPHFGPIVAGYVCGRKSGSEIGGVLCTLLAVGMFYGAVYMLGYYYCDLNLTNPDDPIQQFIRWFYTYEGSGTVYPDVVEIALATVFGLVGGVLARQSRKEFSEILLRGIFDNPIRSMPRSAQLYYKGRTVGFETYEECEERRATVREILAAEDEAEKKRRKGERHFGKKKHRDPEDVTIPVDRDDDVDDERVPRFPGHTDARAPAPEQPFNRDNGCSRNRGKLCFAKNAVP